MRYECAGEGCEVLKEPQCVAPVRRPFLVRGDLTRYPCKLFKPKPPPEAPVPAHQRIFTSCTEVGAAQPVLVDSRPVNLYAAGDARESTTDQNVCAKSGDLIRNEPVVAGMVKTHT